jgi:glycerol-3-phosphate O-acyltransferase/dihydroxyacetone phosphate acyltransferase
VLNTNAAGAVPLRALRRLSLALVSLFYPQRRLEGGQRIPGDVPVVVVANHPNGLLDPVVLALALGRPVRFLAKSTLFGNPLGRLAMAAFGCVPVYRSQDRNQDRGGNVEPGARRDRNEETFAICRQALRAHQWLALFPEGTSHSDAQMRPLKTGAARIALSAAAELGPGAAELVVLPVGLGYDAKGIFRSGLLAHVGRPLPVTPTLALYQRDERAAVEALTAQIRARLEEVVLEAESRELLEGVARVAAWTAAADEVEDRAAHHHRTRVLLEAYQRKRQRDPAALETITRAARDYGRVLRHLGVRDPWGLEVADVSLSRVLWAMTRLLVTAPLAAAGALLCWVPYRLAGPVARRVVGRELDVLSTVKLLAGSLFVLVFWVAEVAVAWWRAGPGAAGLVLLLAPLGGYAALRFQELLHETVMGVRHLWLRRAHGSKVARLVERRRALAAAVAAALDDPSEPPAGPAPDRDDDGDDDGFADAPV